MTPPFALKPAICTGPPGAATTIWNVSVWWPTPIITTSTRSPSLTTDVPGSVPHPVSRAPTHSTVDCCAAGCG